MYFYIYTFLPIQSPHKDVKYTLVGDATAQEYFMVDENTGHISLKKSVVLDPDRRTTYIVSTSFLLHYLCAF